jgi:hypothetical protein
VRYPEPGESEGSGSIVIYQCYSIHFINAIIVVVHQSYKAERIMKIEPSERPCIWLLMILCDLGKP